MLLSGFHRSCDWRPVEAGCINFDVSTVELARIASPEHDKGALEMNIQEAIDLGKARAKVARKNRASVKPSPVEL